MIKQLSEQTAEQLCAQQVITSLPDCIKELIDNSIDAGATYIKITLQEYGKQKIEVIDNGFGICDFDFLGKKGSTSKNKGNDDFRYLGFRGEAIHSIGRVSGEMTIESKCSVDGFRRLFNVNTNALQVFKQERLCHGEFNFQVTNQQNSRSTGTKVTIKNIFEKLPVRHIELHSKYKEFLKKTNELIKEFCLIYPEIQFIFINTRQGKSEIIIETTCLKIFNRSNWLERIKEIDQRIGNSLVYISGQLFQGYVLNKIQSGSSRQNNFIKKNYHYLFLNRRPIDVIHTMQTTLNQIYKKYNNNTKFAFLINLKLSHDMIDVNLTPNKREVFIRTFILEKIIKELKQKISQKVIEEIPTLSSFEDKKKGSQAQQKFSSSQANMLDNFCQKQTEPSQIRKVISFPLKDAEGQVLNNANKQEANKSTYHHRTDDNCSNFRDNLDGARVSFISNQQQLEGKKQIHINKPSKTSSELPELQKISIDMNKLKEKLNSRLSINFNPLKKTSTSLGDQQVVQPATSEKPHPIAPSQLEEIRKQNQQKRLRQEEDDAKKRVQFLKEVKIQYNDDQNHKKSKIINIEKSMQSNTSFKSRQNRSKDNLMEQDLRRRQQEDQIFLHSTITPSKNNYDNQVQQIPSGSFKHIEPSDKNLQNRIKAKLSTDMSQIFVKFNKNKSSQQQQTNGTHNHSIDQSQFYQNRSQNNFVKDNQDHQCPEDNPVQVDNIPLAINQPPEQEALMIDGRGNVATKSIKKQNFRQFQVIGQFNMGFILCVFNHQYFLVDQHAASQKYHYERFLNKSKKLQSIKSEESQQITGIEADEIEDAKILLTQAGFYYKVSERSFLQLQRCPVFFETKLDLDFFWKIVDQKRELYRIPKFTAMCAMKACKTAVVVGNPLRYSEMKNIVTSLADLQSPWNCPHGRPTLVQLGKREALRGKVSLGRASKRYEL